MESLPGLTRLVPIDVGVSVLGSSFRELHRECTDRGSAEAGGIGLGKILGSSDLRCYSGK